MMTIALTTWAITITTTMDHKVDSSLYVRECFTLKMGNLLQMELINQRECYFRSLLYFLTSVIGYIICNQLFIRGRETSENCLNVYLKGWLCYSARLWKDKIDFRESVRCDWHHFKSGRLQFLCQRVSHFKDWKLTSGGLDKSGIHSAIYQFRCRNSI